MALFGSKKKSLQVSLAARKKVVNAPSPLPPLLSDTSKRKLFKNWRITLFIVFFATFILLAFMFSKSLSALALRLIPHSVPATSRTLTPLQKITSEIGKQYLLPEGETPTLAMITSLDELAGQPFFAKAQVGDAVLMYMQAKKAILWRPSTGQIVEIGPINVTEPPPVTQTDAIPTATST